MSTLMPFPDTDRKLTARHHAREESNDLALHTLRSDEELHFTPSLPVNLQREQQGVKELDSVCVSS